MSWCRCGGRTRVLTWRPSGKTTLLLGILGELERVSGDVRIEGSVAYCSQTSFIINGSLKENVLFGLPYEVRCKRWASIAR